MKNKLLAFMLALLATAGTLFAQNRVMGTVTDDIGPVIGASVMEKGTQNGAVTDLDGNYVITVKPGATLPSAMQRRRSRWAASPASMSS